MNNLQKENIKEYIHSHKNHLLSAAVLIVLVIVLAAAAGAGNTEAKGEDVVSGDEYEPAEKFDVDVHPKLNELVTTYFNAYVNADIATLETVVKPLSDMEKSYVTAMSQYYEEYRNVVVYSKQGLSKNAYIVSACFDIKFYDKEELAPSMVLFYVETDEEGNLYINNLYSDFNLRYSELDVDKEVYTALRKYTTQADYMELFGGIEASYNELIKENADIYQLTKRVIPAARQEWEETVYYAASTEADTENTGTTESTESTQQETENTEGTQTTEEQTPPESEEPQVQKVKSTADDVNIRSSASTDSESLGKMNMGDEFVKLGIEGDWTKIEYNGGTGFIKSEFLTDVTE
uniref:SH3 domain-containing protein n=1 Tax=Agathobacter sp. TaxID=2021311 RepID=UPI004055DA76